MIIARHWKICQLGAVLFPTVLHRHLLHIHLSVMPCYQLVLFAKPEATPERLAALFRSVARVVYREAGQFRRVENLGVRPLAYPLRRPGTTYEEVRWVHATFDVAPAALAAVGAAIQADKDVLQYRHLLATDALARFRFRPEKERVKRASGAMRFASEVFDPDTLSFKTKAAAPME
jgi:ribosomal protein S6